jgi:phage shock protein A
MDYDEAMERIEELEQELEALYAENDNLEMECADLRVELIEAEERIKELQTELDGMII